MPLDELARSDVLDALAAREIQLVFSVQPSQLEDALRVVGAANARDLSVGVWPLLEDEEGRWLNPDNAPRFSEWSDRLLNRVAAEGLRITTVALDLEPPIQRVRRMLDGDLSVVRQWFVEPGTEQLKRLVDSVERRGHETLAAVLPFVLAPGRAGSGWQRSLGMRLADVGDATVTAMLYTSLFEGYGAGTLARVDARSLLGRFALRAALLFEERASVSLGAIGVGALGDEQTYRDVSELIDDVAIARSAGVDDLALFDLSGAIARAPLEKWLDAFVETEPLAEIPEPTARALAVTAGMFVTGVALDLG